jgi:hypothetical protein
MTCTHERYLAQQELECLRIAKSCNEGTQAYREWMLTAEALIRRRNEHVVICTKCSKGEKK